MKRQLKKMANARIIRKSAATWKHHSTAIGISILIIGIALQFTNMCLDLPSNFLIYLSLTLTIIGTERIVSGAKNSIKLGNK